MLQTLPSLRTLRWADYLPHAGTGKSYARWDLCWSPAPFSGTRPMTQSSGRFRSALSSCNLAFRRSSVMTSMNWPKAST
jgi:hypothetical protein